MIAHIQKSLLVEQQHPFHSVSSLDSAKKGRMSAMPMQNWLNSYNNNNNSYINIVYNILCISAGVLYS